jgi:CDP-diglyceride synthetase
VTRVLSALVLLPIVIGTVWFLPPFGTLVLALLAAALAFVEYAGIAQALGTSVPRVFTGAAVLAACAAVGGGYVAAEIVLLTALLVVGALAVGSGQPGPAILRDATASIFAIVYIGLPLGALAAVRVMGGR